MPIRAKDRICARPGFEACSGVRNSGGQQRPRQLGKDEKVVPLDGGAYKGPGQDLASSLRVLGPASESTKEGVVIETPLFKAGVLPGVGVEAIY